MPRTAGTIIQATEFNQVVDSYNVLWNDPTTAPFTYDNTLHTSDVERRKGWGQGATTASVSASAKILANDYNTLAAYINSGEYHRQDAGMTVNAYVANVNQEIMATDLNSFETLITNLAGNDTKFDLGADATLTPSVVSESNGGTPWGTADLASALTRGTLTSVLKYTWTDYNHARHFFNSGGQAIIDLEAVGGTNGAPEWDYVFDQVDSIYVGAKTTSSGGANGTGAQNFYSLTTAYQQVYNAVGFDTSGVGSYIGQGGGYSAYGGREVTVNAKLGMDGTNFCMWLQVTLTEDADDVGQVDCDITLYGGHKVAIDSPNSGYLATSNGSNHKIGGTAYIFATVTAKQPTITVDSNWTYSS